jgi:PAS domain S-box-containing protein
MNGSGDQHGGGRKPWVHGLLAPPVFTDPSLTDTARANHWVVVTVVVISLVTLLALVIAYPAQAPRFIGLTAAIVGVSAVALALNRRGALRTVGWLMVGAIWAVALVSALTAGGTINTGISALITLVAVGGVMLGWRTGLLLAVGGIATVFAMAVAQTSGWLPAPAFTQTPWVRAIWLSDFLAITSVAMVLFARELTGARDRAIASATETAASERNMRAVMDNAPFGVHMYRLESDGRLVFVGYNRKAEEMLDLDHTPLLGKTLEEAFPGNIGTETPDGYRRVAREGDIYHQEQYAYDADGIAGIFEVHAFNFGPDRVSVFFRDVTERRKAELALREANEMLAVAQEAARAGLWSWDVPSGELTWTPEFLELFGLPSDALHTFETWRSTLHPDDVKTAETAIAQALADHTPLENEYRIVLTDGSVHWIGAQGTATYAEEGTPLRMSGICLDIDEPKRREEEIGALNEELEQRVAERTRELSATNRELEQFVYSVSHDLRSPLRALDGFSQLLLEDYAGVVDEQGRDYLDRVRSAAQHMGELIDALLALSRVGRREVVVDTVDVTAAARAALAELAEAEPERQVMVTVEEELFARTDAALADVVLRNLIGNAWKFTSREADAKIAVGSSRRNGRVVFYVQDNGAGFDQEHAGSMFRPFQRLHAQNEFPGTGIGLATVQRALDKLGGQCWPEGEPGVGATFSFTLG